VDRSDGTVKDLLTGLVWLKDSLCFAAANRAQAFANVSSLAHAQCGLSDSSSAGDWRLPNVREILSLVDYRRRLPALSAGHPFIINQVTENAVFRYWTSSYLDDAVGSETSNGAWHFDLADGDAEPSSTTPDFLTWPVRND
jgi:hypothetical protein